MIGLMDCNNFFVSCERLFRPDLRGKPVAVLSSKDGCIVARSQEVKDFGIPMGAPYFQVKELCVKHRVTIFSSNFSLYRDISNRVMHALRDAFDEISVYSVDEAFFELEDDITENGIHAIRKQIMQKTGIPVSFGIAPTKTIAKLANSEAKKGNGVVWLTEKDTFSRYQAISCGSVWGIGRETTKKLDSMGIHTVYEFIHTPLRYIRQHFGVHGERLYFELTGIRAEGESHEVSPHASIMSTRSFPHTIEDVAVLEGAIGHHIAHVAEKLRERHLVAGALTIVCAPSRHGAFALREGTQIIALEEPTNNTAELLRFAHKLFTQVYEPGVPYKKAGAIVSGLIPDAFVSESLFTMSVTEPKKNVYDVVDMLNERFGKDTVYPGVVLGTKEWAPRTELRSQEYTTSWSQIASVKAI